MKPTLGLNLSQNLVITPQLQQAIHLLQLSTLDLQQEIQQALEENPLLELEDSANDELEGLVKNNKQEESGQADDNQPSNEEGDWQEDTLPEELAVDANWDDIYTNDFSSSSYTSNSPENADTLESQDTYAASLQDHLLWQLNLNIKNPQDLLVGLTLIDSINSDGYLELDEDLEDFTQGLIASHPDLHQLSLEDVEAVLQVIQGFEPAGVAARNLTECLLLQLKQFCPHTPFLNAAVALVENYLPMLANKDFSFLRRRLKLRSNRQLEEVTNLIKLLNPKPGEAYNDTSTNYIIPDLLLKPTANGWLVELNPEAQPRLRVHESYGQLIKHADTSATKDYLRGHHRDAIWLIKSLENRGETLLKVGREIVARQQKFFTHGPEFMQPLILSDIAQVVEVHESTVSRATTNKYIHTPKGMFELKYFFSSHLTTSSGEDASSTAIKALLQKLINEEPSKKPLSDNKLSQLLAEQGIQIARRTIAKYRESMNIPPSNERKELS